MTTALAFYEDDDNEISAPPTAHPTPSENAAARSKVSSRTIVTPTTTDLASRKNKVPLRAMQGAAPDDDAPAGAKISPRPKETAAPRAYPAGESKQAPATNARTEPIDCASLVPTNIADNHNPPGTHTRLGLADPTLKLAAEVVDDLERTRMANYNRLRQLTRAEADLDGESRGLGLSEDHPDVARLALICAAIHALEKDAVKNLEKVMRRHPMRKWQVDKAQTGVGDKQFARLLAAVGDPYWNTLHDRPRTVSELWAFCGHHVIPTGESSGAPRAFIDGRLISDLGYVSGGAQEMTAGVAAHRRKGQKSNWSDTARMRAHLIAKKCVQQDPGTRWRDCYTAARAKYADSTHKVDCVRCGPKGKPALAGSPLSAGHQHARALRIVAKELLKEMWREAKRIHDEAAT